MWQLVSRPFQKSSIQRRTIQTKTTESHVGGVEKMFLSSGDCEILENFEQLLSSNLNFQISGTGVAFASFASLVSSLKNWMQSIGCYLMLNLKLNPNENVEVGLALDTK